MKMLNKAVGNEDLIGLIPAAGKGTRLGLPYPKELYPIIRENRYKPISQFVLNSLTAGAVGHIVFVVNETKHQLMAFFGDGHRFGCNISYVIQESNDEPGKSTSPGLAHALNSAYHLTRGKTVLFGMADTIMQPHEAFKLALAAAGKEDDAILMLFPTERPEKFGIVRLDENKRVLQIIDKPHVTDLTLMWGGIIWRPRFTEFLNDCICRQGISDFAIIMNRAIASGLRFRGFEIEGGTFIDLGTYEEIMELDRKLREG
jgi:glucose-1-phosphate thymidylyltransferase